MPGSPGPLDQRACHCAPPAPAPAPLRKTQCSFSEQRDNTCFSKSLVISLNGVAWWFYSYGEGGGKNNLELIYWHNYLKNKIRNKSTIRNPFEKTTFWDWERSRWHHHPQLPVRGKELKKKKEKETEWKRRERKKSEKHTASQNLEILQRSRKKKNFQENCFKELLEDVLHLENQTTVRLV